MPRLCKTEHTSDYTELRAGTKRMNEANDCGVISVAIVCNVSYEVAHEALRKAGRVNRTGTWAHQSQRAIERLGYKVTYWGIKRRLDMIKTYPAPHNNLQSITTHHLRRFPAAWAGCHRNMLFFSQAHVLAVKDGIVRDWSINKALRVVDIWEVEKV